MITWVGLASIKTCLEARLWTHSGTKPIHLTSLLSTWRLWWRKLSNLGQPLCLLNV